MVHFRKLCYISSIIYAKICDMEMEIKYQGSDAISQDVQYSASNILDKAGKIFPVDREQLSNHPVYNLETFIDTERIKCYKAANRVYHGNTAGHGKSDQTHKPNRSNKAVWGYPLSKNFRRLLQHGQDTETS